MEPFRTDVLPNGLRIAFYDETNRYFGDYHRVCLRVVLSVDTSFAGLATAAEAAFWQQVAAACGETLQVIRKLERMGVPGVAVEGTVASLIDDFLATSAYLSRPDYPRRLAEEELRRHDKPGRFY